MKQCKICKELKPIELFYKHRKNLSSYCKKCHIQLNKDNRIKRGITEDAYRDKWRRDGIYLNKQIVLDKLEKLNYTCECCGTWIDEKNFHQDHNHTTKKLRGLLCRKCNIGIGHFDDDPELLRLAATYLERYNNNINELEDLV